MKRDRDIPQRRSAVTARSSLLSSSPLLPHEIFTGVSARDRRPIKQYRINSFVFVTFHARAYGAYIGPAPVWEVRGAQLIFR